MTDLDPRPADSSDRPRPEGEGAVGREVGPIPVRVRRRGELEDEAPDAVGALAVLGTLVAILGSTCLPLTAAYTIAARRAGLGGDPATLPAALDGPTTLTLAGVLAFLAIALLGVAGGVGSLLRRQWGRWLMLAYAVLVLLYLAAAVTARLRYGITGMTATAPTRSALVLNITCSFGVILAVAVLMVAIVRYFTLPRIVRRFR